jgi:superfamily II DNA helicase RecQ
MESLQGDALSNLGSGGIILLYLNMSSRHQWRLVSAKLKECHLSLLLFLPLCP